MRGGLFERHCRSGVIIRRDFLGRWLFLVRLTLFLPLYFLLDLVPVPFPREMQHMIDALEHGYIARRERHPVGRDVRLGHAPEQIWIHAELADVPAQELQLWRCRIRVPRAKGDEDPK